MANGFVAYLNSMNNANSGNENALAESQILNDYYEKIRIERKIGDYIYKLLFTEKNKAVILTGHAGDGKTSILVQILRKLGYFNNGKKSLLEKELFNNNFFYVKDMSELNEDNQEMMLKQLLIYPTQGISSMLISNTGPLINTFKRLIKFQAKKSSCKEYEINKRIEEFEMKLLNGIDNVESPIIKFNFEGNDYEFIIINIANIDNSYFVREIFDKILQEQLWEDCLECINRDKCPVYTNKQNLVRNKKRVVDFIERLYIWFNENESRLTIRQMLSHITYAITGNLNCDSISKQIINQKNSLFKYSFANLFFGYRGFDLVTESSNIRAIRELNKVKLDEIALKEDYTLFVKEDYCCFDKFNMELLEDILNQNIGSLSIQNENSVKLRRAFRRFYILFSIINENEFNQIVTQLFSDVFSMYYKLITTDDISKNFRDKISDMIFQALYKIYIGVYPLKNENTLFLTLKKNYNDMQNVQLVQGDVRKDKINLKQDYLNNNIEQTTKMFIPYIKIGKIKYDLNLQTLDYLNKTKEGAIFTSLNPTFTFGLTKLKADLLNEFRYDDDEEIKVLVIKRDTVDGIRIYIENTKLHAIEGRW